MKKNTFSIPIIFFILTLAVSGCSPSGVQPTLAATPAETKAPTQTNTATQTVEPAKTATPTEPPKPIPCNITFDSNRDGNIEVYRMGPDGSGPVNLTRNKGEDSDPVWSPDGSQIAFVSNRENGKEGGQFIYIMKADGSGVRQLSLENESKWPDWSHDGQRITYSHKGDIFVMAADGSGQAVNLTNSPEKDEQSMWSPDGKKILWLMGDEKNQYVFVMNADGSGKKQITDNGRNGHAEWTIDGRIITGWGWKGQNEFCHNCVVNADGTGIVDGGGKDVVHQYTPFWTLDGEMVGVANVDMFSGDNEIYLVGKNFPDPKNMGAGFLNLTNHPSDDRNPDWPATCGPANKPSIKEMKAPKQPGQIIIGYAGDEPKAVQRKNNFQKACNELKIKCIYGEIPELLDAGVVAIVQNTQNGVFADPANHIQKAVEKGIPVFILDTELDLEGVYSVSANHHDLITAGPEWMFKKMGGKGEFAYFKYPADAEQITILEELLKKYPGIKVVEQREGSTDVFQIKTEVGEMINAYPDLKAIWTSQFTTEVIFGVQDMNLPAERWPMMMCEATKDGLYIWKDRLATNPKMACFAASNPPGIAYDAVYAAYYKSSGLKIKEKALGGKYGFTFTVDFPVILKDSMLQSLKKIDYEDGSYVVDKWMEPEKIKEMWFEK